MTMRWVLVVPLVLAACTDPRTTCLRAASAELVALDSRIAQAERDIARGYSILPAQDPQTRLRFCNWPKEPVLFCTEQVRAARSETRVPITDEQGQVLLENLRAERAALVRRVADAQAQCR